MKALRKAKKITQKKVIKTKKAKVIKKSPKKNKPKLTRKKITKIIPLFKKDAIGHHETVVEQSKFFMPPSPSIVKLMPKDLPWGYGVDQISLQVRDPWWLHTFWEVTGNTWESLRARFKDVFNSSKRVLRVYDVTDINFNGNNAHRFFDIEVSHDVSSWYINAASPGRSWCVDFGLILPDGSFVTIVRSNIVHSPLDGPSWITDEEWMIPDDLFAKLYGMGFGLGRQSSPVGKAWVEKVRKMVVSSPGITSASSPTKKKDRSFWFILDCELIVYGATQPDAKVTLGNKEIKLRPDGTFTLRFALPDGKQVLAVKAESADGVEERTITPIVLRETKNSNNIKQAV